MEMSFVAIFLGLRMTRLPLVGLIFVGGMAHFQMRSVNGQDASTESTVEDRAASPRYVVPPEKVEGHQQCVDCHRAEVAAWKQSKHATLVFDELRTSPNSKTYAQALGIRETDIARNSMCVTCHATPRLDERGRPRVIAGVSCEACHNASGGEDGWLNIHAVYGPPGTGRQQESRQHYDMRIARCTQAGQRRSADVFRLAQGCFHCHIVSDEALVNTANHKTGNSGGFEFVAWSLGEVRHNFFIDQQNNAEVATLWTSPLWRADKREGTAVERIRVMYVAGWLADLEVSLRFRALATEDGAFADALNTRIEDAYGELEGIVEELEVDLPTLQEAIDAVVPIIDDHLEEVNPDNKGIFIEAAKKVEAAALQFERTHDGSQLEELDEYGIPTVDDARGPVYQPSR